MSKYLKKLEDLFSTESRTKLIDLIMVQKGPFNAKDIFCMLESSGTNIKVAEIQKLLRILEYRKVVLGTELKRSKAKGRLGRFYEVHRLYGPL